MSQAYSLLCLELGRLATSRRGGCVTERRPAPAHVRRRPEFDVGILHAGLKGASVELRRGELLGLELALGLEHLVLGPVEHRVDVVPVSYTHLTLPTILLV